MKQCSQCLQRYDDDSEFCISDGSSLVSPGEKSQSRVVVSWDDQQLGNETPTQFVSIPQNASNPQTSSNNTNLLYAVIGGLVAVILIGGAYLFLASFGEKDKDKARVEASNIPSDSNPANVSNIGNSASSRDQDQAATNSAGEPTNVDESGKNNKADRGNAEKDRETSKSDENARGKLLRKGYNGRVIMLNAIVRSSPSIYAPEIYVVSFDEPIKIGKSAGGNNPWFRVTATGGRSGWMHGNTIEFVR